MRREQFYSGSCDKSDYDILWSNFYGFVPLVRRQFDIQVTINRQQLTNVRTVNTSLQQIYAFLYQHIYLIILDNIY